MARVARSAQFGAPPRLGSPAPFFLLFSLTALAANPPEALYTQKGTDIPFEKIIAKGDLPKGTNSDQGITGSKIEVNHRLVELTPDAKRKIPEDIHLHTLGSSSVAWRDFKKWSRWYQEDGSTQVFRLYVDEVNRRNERSNAARVEAFSMLNWKQGDWREWSGTFTIIKPHGCSIFQVKNTVNDWAGQLVMNDKGDVILNHRRAPDKVLAQNMTGKPFYVVVRDNGLNYEITLGGVKVGEGEFARPQGQTTFRWGMY